MVAFREPYWWRSRMTAVQLVRQVIALALSVMAGGAGGCASTSKSLTPEVIAGIWECEQKGAVRLEFRSGAIPGTDGDVVFRNLPKGIFASAGESKYRFAHHELLGGAGITGTGTWSIVQPEGSDRQGRIAITFPSRTRNLIFDLVVHREKDALVLGIPTGEPGGVRQLLFRKREMPYAALQDRRGT